ncbi:hypothetical protein [Streptomyces sp. NPDC058145]|uniref:hypothetical protein n=1 Tax=Streptomyces sp. NPDC058145 TaxID=3346356 RepID=UPI0036E7BDA5
MSADEGGLPDEGLSLWLTDYRMDVGEPWQGRRLVAVVGRRAAGNLDFHVHPDGQALRVWILEVYPGFQRRGLASVLMDALYAAYPTAWINHGTRSRDGAHWWDGYRERDPRRNVHNRPPGEWAAYFDPVEVASDRAQLAHRNDRYGLDGHRDAVYRYGERGEQEADDYVSLYRPVQAAMLDPAAQPLHGATRLFLPPSLHAHVHDERQAAASRAEALLEYLGHGNLPRTRWYGTRQQAFEDAYHQEIFEGSIPARGATHVTFTLNQLDRAAVASHTVTPALVDFTAAADIPVEVAEVSWRDAQQPHHTHTAAFTPAVEAAIAPGVRWRASAAYTARYDEAGILRAPAASETSAAGDAEIAEQVRAMADWLLEEQASRTTPPRPQHQPRSRPAAPAQDPMSAEHRTGRAPGQ